MSKEKPSGGRGAVKQLQRGSGGRRWWAGGSCDRGDLPRGKVLAWLIVLGTCTWWPRLLPGMGGGPAPGSRLLVPHGLQVVVVCLVVLDALLVLAELILDLKIIQPDRNNYAAQVAVSARWVLRTRVLLSLRWARGAAATRLEQQASLGSRLGV